MKKLIITLLFIGSFFFGYCQMKTSVIYLKTGEKLVVKGKVSGNYFKYKMHTKVKVKKIHFSKIEFVNIRFSKDDIKKYKFFKVKETNNTVVVQELLIGDNAELYAKISQGFSGGDINSLHVIIDYYAKKTSDKELTHFGAYNPLVNNLKEKVKHFFRDCNKLILKIEKREFKIRSDIEKIIEFYNQECP